MTDAEFMNVVRAFLGLEPLYQKNPKAEERRKKKKQKDSHEAWNQVVHRV